MGPTKFLEPAMCKVNISNYRVPVHSGQTGQEWKVDLIVIGS